MDYLEELSKCYIDKCNKEFRLRKTARDLWFARTNKINNDYKNNIISKQEFMKKIKILDNTYFNSIQEISLHKCEIDKCYNLVKKYLDYLSHKLNYKEKDVYTVYDYINLIKK